MARMLKASRYIVGPAVVCIVFHITHQVSNMAHINAGEKRMHLLLFYCRPHMEISIKGVLRYFEFFFEMKFMLFCRFFWHLYYWQVWFQEKGKHCLYCGVGYKLFLRCLPFKSQRIFYEFEKNKSCHPVV